MKHGTVTTQSSSVVDKFSICAVGHRLQTCAWAFPWKKAKFWMRTAPNSGLTAVTFLEEG